jgi:outer membrane protein OmpA-like peptidoglycan-associated protein
VNALPGTPTTGGVPPQTTKEFDMNLKRAAVVAAILLLALPSAALADDAGTDGVIVDGANLVTLVNGQNAPGAISVRFADDPTYALFYENRSFNGVTPTAPGNFVIQEGGVAYSQWGTQFTQAGAPAQTGAGTVASPWVVTSGFTSSDLHVLQKVSHVDGSRSLTLTWRVTNATVHSIPLRAFWNTDLYVAGSDQGVGALVAGPPRTLQGVAIDGTKAGLVQLTPWTHYYEGDYSTAQRPAFDPTATYDDTFDASSVDNGFGVQWNRTLAAGASTTLVLGFRASEPGGAPVPAVAPDITGSPVSGPSRSATFDFAAHAGDTATVAFECSIDGGLFNPCVSPEAFAGLARGEHVFRVHGINSDGDFGPAASAMWTTTAVRRHHPAAGRRPGVHLARVTVARDRFKVGCSLASGAIAKCAVTLVGPGRAVLGRGVRVFGPAHQHRHGKVEVVLTRRGRARAARAGGVRTTAIAVVLPVGGAAPLVARSSVRLVAPSVDVTPGALRFESGSAVLLPAGRDYLRRLAPRLGGAKRILAIGSTDDLGSAEANYLLGLARADAVCAILAHRSHAACMPRSDGERHPRATNATAAGRALNRRVELKVRY